MQFLLTLLFTTCAIFIFANSSTQLFLAFNAFGRKQITPTHKSKSFSTPTVLVQLPIYNEQHVVERLIEAVSKIDYPKDKIVIQLLDDSADITSEIAAKAIAALDHTSRHHIFHIRRTGRDGFKAGALSHGMTLAKGDLIAIFDADFIPDPSFVRCVVPEFDDPSVGLVQTRWAHLNADHNLFTQLMAIAIDNHFTVEHVGKLRVGAFINFNGTAGMWRREAIERSGGWSSDSLTEDLDLSFRAQFNGWKFVYLDEIETESELPSVLSELRSQQFRWTKGSAEAGKKNLGKLWCCDASVPAKLIGSLQLTNSLIFPAVLLIGACALGFHILGQMEYKKIFLTSCALLSAASLSTTIAFATGQLLRGRSSIYEQAAALAKAQLFVVFSTGFALQNSFAAMLGWAGRKSEFVRTQKSGLNHSAPGKVVVRALGGRSFSKFLPVEFALAVGFFCASYAELGRHELNSYALITVLMSFGAGFGMMTFFSVEEALDSWQFLSFIRFFKINKSI